MSENKYYNWIISRKLARTMNIDHDFLVEVIGKYVNQTCEEDSEYKFHQEFTPIEYDTYGKPISYLMSSEGCISLSKLLVDEKEINLFKVTCAELIAERIKQFQNEDN